MAKKKKKKCPFDLDNRAKKNEKKHQPMARPNTNVLQKEVEEKMKKLRRGLL